MHSRNMHISNIVYASHHIRPGLEVCFQKRADEVLKWKSKIAVCTSFTVWGPGAYLRAPVGSRGKAPRSSRVLEHIKCKTLSKFALF